MSVSKLIFSSLLICTFIGLTSCGGNADASADETTEEATSPVNIDSLMDDQNGVVQQPPRSSYDFKEQFGAVVYQYILIKEALISNDISNLQDNGLAFVTAISNVATEEVNEAGLPIFSTQKDDMVRSLNKMINSQDIAAVRENFKDLSIAVIELQKTLGSNTPEVYLMHCPTALNGAGASWLSMDQQIRNPYGDQSCGQVMEDLTTQIQ